MIFSIDIFSKHGNVIKQIINVKIMTQQNGYHDVVHPETHILFTCEHASKNIPEQFHHLGLTQDERDHAKDLYDPGARALTEVLSDIFHASALYADVSRLVIDYNRRLNAATKNNNTFHAGALKTELLVEKNGTDHLIKIPKNIFPDQQAFEKEEKQRYETYVTPYIERAYDIVDTLHKKHKKIYIVQIHSFFPIYNDIERNVDIAVLYDQAEETAHRIMADMRQRTPLIIADNNPWSMKDTDGAVFEKIYNMDNVDVVTFDVNNKHLKTQNDIQKISRLIADTLRAQLF